MIAHLYKITNNLTNQYYIGKGRGPDLKPRQRRSA